MDCLNLGSISQEIILILPKNFLDFKFYAIKKRIIRYFSRYRSTSCASVVLGDSEVTFLRKERMQFLFISLLFSVNIRRCKIELS